MPAICGFFYGVRKMPLPNILEFIGTNITQRKFQEAQEKLLNYLGIEVPTKTELSSTVGTLNTAIAKKTDKTYVDNALTSLTNGASKFYPTLAEANADIANIAIKDKVEVGEIANGGTWYKATAEATSLTKSSYDPLTQAKNYTDIKVYDVDVDKLSRSDIFTESSNLFDYTAVTRGYTIQITGEVTANADFAFSDFIAVNPSEFYYFDGFRDIAFYDINKSFISRFGQVMSGSGTAADPYKYYGAIQTPSNCYYIRANYSQVMRTDSLDGRKINKGSVSLPYEHFSLRLNKSVSVSGVNLESKSVSVSAIEFIEESKNLFNPATVTNGKAILDTGAISDNASYAISDFIAVEDGQKYTISSSDPIISPFIYIAYYDHSKVFISRYGAIPVGTQTLTMPASTAFVRFNINVATTGQPSEKQRMFNVGETALPYEEWSPPKLVGVSVDSEINIDQVEQIVDEKFDQYIEQSYNLFDHTKATIGNSISVTGELLDREDFAISDFIAVDGEQEYTSTSDKGFNAWIHIVYYDANKNFISRVQTSNEATGFLTITTPQLARFVRFNINLNTGLPSQRNRMFVKGDKVLSYTPARNEFSITPTHTVLKTIGSEVKLSRADNFIFDYELNELFTTSATLGSHLNFNSSTSAQVYQMYDDLMTAHPNHITKQVLGDDVWGNPIALYRFKAPQPTTSQHTKMPKVFLTTGVHGMEHVAVLTAYLMFEQMMNNWRSSNLLEVLRNNVEFLIIPVVNPSGYNKYTRKNDNGVDINRNFPDGFGWQSTDPASAYYGGAAPLDQLESQYIVRVFDENPDIDVMYDFHNFNGVSAESNPNLIWIAGYTEGQYVEHMTQSLVRKLTNHWRDKFTWIPQSETWFAGFSNTTEGAMVKDYAVHSRGIPFTATFEVGGRWWIDPTGVPYDLNHKQSCLEALVNFITINLNELKRI